MERPFPAYEGTEPFVFVCYAHDDAALVYPEITRLRGAGFNIWYDEGISPGSEWSEALAAHIQQCAVFLFFVTPRSVLREHCRREVNFALEERCTILPVHLEQTDVPPALKLSLSHRQAIIRHEHPAKSYEQKLDRALEAAALGRAEPEVAPTRLQIGDWLLDVANHRLSRAGEERPLEPKDLNVLLHLAEAAPNLVSSEALLDRSWPDTVVGDNALHQVIGRLRRALGDDARSPRYVETVPKSGYRLLVPVTDPPPQASKQQEAEPPGLKRISNPALATAIGTVIVLLVGAATWWARSPDLVVSSVEVAARVQDRPGSVACTNLLQGARFGGNNLAQQLELAEEATRVDPGCAEAFAHKGWILSTMSEFGELRPRDGFAAARNAAERALALNPELPQAFGVLGAVQSRLDLDFVAAMEAYERAEALGGTTFDVSWKQDTLLNAGLYEEGLAFQRKAELEDPRSLGAKFYTARFLVRLGQRDAALSKVEEVVSGDRLGTFLRRQVINFFLYDLVDGGRARELLENSQLPTSQQRFFSARIALTEGDPRPLRELVLEYADGSGSAFSLWHDHYELGNYAEHMRWFAKTVEERMAVSWIMDFMNYRHPDYWPTLRAWAAADPGDSGERQRLLSDHEGLIAKVTERMHLKPRSVELGVVVLPFDNLSVDDANGYLADGLSVELMSILRSVPGLRVAPQTSSFYFGRNPAPLNEIGSALDVTHALEGSVRKEQSNIKVTASLVSVADGETLWFGKFERSAESLLDLQNEVAVAIVDALAPLLSASEPRRPADVGTQSEEAFELYLRATDLVRKDNAADLLKAEQLYEAAIVADPDFLNAYRELARVATSKPFRIDGDFAGAYEQLTGIRERVLALDAADSAAFARGEFFRQLFRRNYSDAEEIARRQLARHPDDLAWLEWYSMVLRNGGLFEPALEYLQVLWKKDPYNPQHVEWIGDMLLALERPKEALAAFERCLQLAPERYGCNANVQIALVKLGRAEEIRDRWPEMSAFHRCVLLEELSACEPDGEGLLPQVRAFTALALGDREGFYRWLNVAADQPYGFIDQLRWQHLHYGVAEDSLERDALLARLNLTDAWKDELCRRAQKLTPATGIPVSCP